MAALKTRTLGKSGIAVTEIGMGLWAAGGDQWGPTDDQAVPDAIEHALVASKIGWRGFDSWRGQSAYGSVEKLIAGAESNLRRLQTDYIDVMQSHINYREPTMEVFLEGFQTLQEQGKIRAYGVSTGDFAYL